MRCAIYRRVSTEMQREEGFSLEAQKLRLEAFAESQGWTIIEDYSDEGFSAKNMDRPQLQRMISDMKKQKFDVILVYRLDRFVRSVTDLHELLQMMDKYEVKFKSSTEAFDTTSATGRMFITIIATLAQWERETIAERVYDAMYKRSEQGLRNGAPAPYGYEIVDGNLVVNPEEAKWVKFIFSQYGTHGSQNIAKKLNSRGIPTKKGEIWSDFSVRYALKNPIYAGYVRWNYETVTSGHRKRTGDEVIVPLKQEGFEPIITKEKWDETQQLLTRRRNDMAFRSQTHYPFSGIVKCAKCGKSFTGSQKNRKAGGVYRFYKCQGRFRFGTCDVQTIAESSIEEVFLSILDLEDVDPELVSKNSTPGMDRKEIETQLNKLEGKKKRLKELYIEGEIPKSDYNKDMAKLKDEEVELSKLLEVQDELASDLDVKEVLREIKKEWHNLSDETKKEAIQSLFEYITVEVVEPTKPGKTPVPPVLKITDYQLR